jgi:hypothetical protein
MKRGRRYSFGDYRMSRIRHFWQRKGFLSEFEDVRGKSTYKTWFIETRFVKVRKSPLIKRGRRNREKPLF